MRANTTETLLGREYVRVSADPTGNMDSTSEQHDDNTELAEELGFTLNGEAYVETDADGRERAVSGSRYGMRVRGGFAQLLIDLRSGAFGADILVVWEISRLSRDVDDWPGMLLALEAAGVRLAVTERRRIFDPADCADRTDLLQAAVEAEKESHKISARVGRSARRTAKKGGVWGTAPYGYYQETVTVFDPAKGKNVRRAVRHVSEPEAAVVRGLFRRVAAGDSFTVIAEDFADAGITNPRTGKPFSADALGQMVLRPAYAGLRLRVPHETVLGDDGKRKLKKGNHRGSLDTAVLANWDAIVDDETFFKVRRMMTSRQRPGQRNGAHLLGNVARCDVCGGLLAASRPKNRPTYLYKCKAGHLGIGETALDELAETVMLEFLADPANVELDSGATDEELSAARTATDRARSELEEFYAEAAKMSPRLAALQEPAKLAAVAAAEKYERDLAAPSELSGLIEPGADIELRWGAAPMAARRRVAKILLSPGVLGELCVKPVGPKRKNVPAIERTEFRSAAVAS